MMSYIGGEHCGEYEGTVTKPTSRVVTVSCREFLLSSFFSRWVKKVKKLPAGGAAAQAKLDRAKYETHWTGSDSIFISQQRMTFDK